MTTVHLVLRYAHISMGMLALASGAAAMILRKGSRPHRQSGNVFFAKLPESRGAFASLQFADRAAEGGVT
jgi:hypothetical protein